MSKQYPAKSLTCKTGDLVVGIRGGKKDNYILGTFVDHYYTLNNGFRNYASHIKRLSDGKIVSFQRVRKIETPAQEEAYRALANNWKTRWSSILADRMEVKQ